MKKTLPILLAVTLATTLGASPALASQSSQFKSQFKWQAKFKDVGNDDWSIRFVTEMSTKGVISGYGDGQFRPSANVSHEEALVMTIRSMGLTDEAKELTDATLDIKDANKVSEWARPYVAMALKKGLIDQDAALEPQAKADREWVTEMIVRALGLETEAQAHMADTLSFKDAKEIDADAVGYIAVAAENKIITGYEDKTFKPNKPVQRNELAVILCNAEHLFEYDEDRQEQTVGQLQGTFQSSANGKLTFKSLSNASISYELADNYYVFFGNEIAKLSDLKAGMWIRVLLNANNEVVFVQGREQAPTREEIETHAKGTVVEYIAPSDNTPGSITLTQPHKIVTDDEAENNAWGEGHGHGKGNAYGQDKKKRKELDDYERTIEKKITLAIAPGAKITSDGKSKSFTDVKVGNYVDLTIINNTVLGIDIKPTQVKEPELRESFVIEYVKNNLKTDLTRAQARTLFGEEDAVLEADDSDNTVWRFDFASKGYEFESDSKTVVPDLEGLESGDMKMQLFIEWNETDASGAADFYYTGNDGELHLYKLSANGKASDTILK